MNFKSYYSSILIVILTLISILISSVAWNYINFSIPNIQELGRGHYIENDYNKLNEILRYLTFVSLPLITFLSSMIYSKKIEVGDFFKQLKFSENSNENDYRFIKFLKLLIFAAT